MYLADYHTHTRISPDAGRSMTEMAEAALAAGMDEICFTDHMEPMTADRKERVPYDWAGLSREFQEAREAMGDRIRLRLGVELGEILWDLPYTEELMAQAPPLDFVIGSNHVLSEKYGDIDWYYYRSTDEDMAREAIKDYLVLEKRMAEWGQFDVLGHLTLPLRYLNENLGLHMTFDGFESQVEEIFRILIQKGLGIEVNTNRGHTPLPDGKWLRMYRDMGGEIITLGTDAHTPEYVGKAVRENHALLKSCGFSRFCTFQNREPVWHTL